MLTPKLLVLPSDHSTQNGNTMLENRDENVGLPVSGPTEGMAPHGSPGLSQSLWESLQISGDDSAGRRALGFIIKSSLMPRAASRSVQVLHE